jgi:lysozyme family protein
VRCCRRKQCAPEGTPTSCDGIIDDEDEDVNNMELVEYNGTITMSGVTTLTISSSPPPPAISQAAAAAAPLVIQKDELEDYGRK